MRILKGYSKAEQKELENIKKLMSCNDLLNTLTSFQPSNMEYDYSIKDKYNKAKTDERISIIRDILDFYTDSATFPLEKYVVHDSTTDEYIVDQQEELHWAYLNSCAEKKTKDEWLKINPAYEAMLEKVEDNEKI